MADWMSLAGGLLGALGSGDSKQTQSAEKTPWGPSQGWLTNNINSGQQLQDYYQRNPLSADQLQAYANSKALSGGARSMFGNLTNQINSTQFFDRSNPLGRPQALQFTSQGYGDAQASGTGGGLSAPFNSFSRPAASQVQSNPFGTGISDRGGSGGGNKQEAGWYQTTTPEERMAFFADHPFQAGITGLLNEYATKLPYIGGLLDPNLAKQYAAEARGTYGAQPSGPVGAGIAANPMGLDPAQQAQAAQAQAAAAAAQQNTYTSILGNSYQQSAADRNSQMDNAARGSWM